jgi:hypothetical protein
VKPAILKIEKTNLLSPLYLNLKTLMSDSEDYVFLEKPTYYDYWDDLKEFLSLVFEDTREIAWCLFESLNHPNSTLISGVY